MYAMSQFNDHEAPSALKMLKYEMERGKRLYQARSRDDLGFLRMPDATAILLGENSSMVPVIQPGQLAFVHPRSWGTIEKPITSQA